MARCWYGLALMLSVGCASAKQADFTGSVGNPGGGASDLAGASMSVTDMAQPIIVLDLSTPPPTEDMTNGSGCVTGSSCYTGPAGTLGVGACKAGTQTCGAGGTCTGEVVPAAIEDCFNNVDDDCDGVINNGCPTAVTIGTPTGLTAQGNPNGGSAFSHRCPANYYVSKIVVYGDSTDEYIAGIDIDCATPTLVAGANSYSITPTPQANQPNLTEHAANITTSANSAFDCGTSSFTPGYFTEGLVDSGGIDELGLSCATSSLSFSPATDKLTITLAQGTNASASGYPFGNSWEDDCPTGSVLVGFDGRDGNWFDELQPVCAPLSVTYK